MEPFYDRDGVTVYHGDSVEVLRQLPEASVHAIVTDPPYGLEFMGQEWDAPWRSAADDPDAGFGRVRGPGSEARAFQAWCESWARECLRVLTPGGHIAAFGGSRTWHRLAAGIEDAGFEVRDSFAWFYGTGFPKSRNVTDAMQAYLADDRGPVDGIRPGVYEVTAYLRAARDAAGWGNKQIDALFGTTGMAGHWTSKTSQPAVPSVRQWEVLKDALGMGDAVDHLVRELASTERPEDWGTRDRSDERFLASLRDDPEVDTEPHGWGDRAEACL